MTILAHQPDVIGGDIKDVSVSDMVKIGRVGNLTATSTFLGDLGFL